MTDLVTLPDGRVIVPDNRWDTISTTADDPTVAVVVPYYDQPEQLSRVLDALAAQSYPSHLVEVVVADDGSATAPDVSRWVSVLDVSVVRQADRGFRAAAARNLGAAASTGSILCFLDADTVPSPDYVRHAVRLPAAAPDVLVVGRRKHVDLASQDPLPDPASADGEPQWLVDGYRRTSNLLEPGWDGYKYVLSAVMTCSRTLFDAAGGFDESFERYGGEDWEFANRAFMVGAVLAHEPRALAWHDGPDWAERSVDDRTTSKNAEALAVAKSITDPAARTAGLQYLVPDVVVVLDADGQSAASLFTTIASVVRGADCAVWVSGDGIAYDELGVWDSRVRRGEPDSGILSRCRYVVRMTGRVVFSDTTLSRLTAKVGPGRAGEVVVEFGTAEQGSVTVYSSRALHRARRWCGYLGTDEDEIRHALFGCARTTDSEVAVTVATSEPWLAW